MYCPKCGQQSASDSIRSCSSCDFQLEGVADFLADKSILATNPGEYNLKTYQKHWNDLNRQLSKIRQEKGLGAVLEALAAQQLDAGFIEDDLRSVNRYRIPHPSDRSRSFSIQYNPRRTLRRSGAGRSEPPPGTKSVNNGCFLCRENIWWMQRGIEVGYDLTLGDTAYVCYCNPFPLMPIHITVATEKHLPQAWSTLEKSSTVQTIEQVLSHLLMLAEELPGYVLFFNGPGAGALIPTHFHFQLFKRPAGHEPFALERALIEQVADIKISPKIKDYPIAVAYFAGHREDIAREASAWTRRLSGIFESPESLSANIIATADSSGLNLYIVPRHQSYSYAQGMVGLVAGLEILGELVLSTDIEKQNLDHFHYNYDSVAQVLAAVEPPGIRQCIERIFREPMTVALLPQVPSARPKAKRMVGILAAGGEGSRYSPFKHLDSVFDKPALFSFVAQLMQAGIQDIMIVCSELNRFNTEEMVRKDLSHKCGANSSFCTTPKANGPAGVFLIPAVREFVKGCPVALMLDGIYFGGDFAQQAAICGQVSEGCTILASHKVDARPFGWIKRDENRGEIIDLIEKPDIPPDPSHMHLVQTHLYFYGPDVAERVEQLQPSQNGEYDVVSLHKSYLSDVKLCCIELADTEESKLVWDDAGTPEKRLDLGSQVREYQGADRLVGSPHLIGCRNGWITREALIETAESSHKSAYWTRLLKILTANANLYRKV